MSRHDPRGLNVAVTGGAHGIGAATVRLLHEKGAQVAIGDRDLDAAARLATELGDRAIGLPLVVSAEDSFELFLEDVEATHGPLDVLINNAGVDWIGPFHEKPLTASRREIDVNLWGCIIGTSLALERMLPRGTGHIVNVASANGRVPSPGSAVYGATKYAIVGLTESLRLEYRDSGVDFSLIHPGQTATAMLDGTVRPSKLLKVVQPEDLAESIVDAIERRRFEVWVPPETKAAVKLGGLLPRNLYERALIGLGVDKIATHVDHDQRAAYHRSQFEGQS